MNPTKPPSPLRKTIILASLAYGAFTTISILGPIILDRLWNRPRPQK